MPKIGGGCDGGFGRNGIGWPNGCDGRIGDGPSGGGAAIVACIAMLLLFGITASVGCAYAGCCATGCGALLSMNNVAAFAAESGGGFVPGLPRGIGDGCSGGGALGRIIGGCETGIGGAGDCAVGAGPCERSCSIISFE